MFPSELVIHPAMRGAVVADIVGLGDGAVEFTDAVVGFGHIRSLIVHISGMGGLGSGAQVGWSSRRATIAPISFCQSH